MSSGVWGGGGREGGARSPSREQRRSIPPHKVVKGRERAPMQPLAVWCTFLCGEIAYTVFRTGD